jgi:YggT family protein
MGLIGYILMLALEIYFWLLLVRALISWIPLIVPNFTPRGPLLAIFEFIYTLTDPPLRFLGRFIPPLRLGNVSLDLGFMVLLVIILVLQRVVGIIFS